MKLLVDLNYIHNTCQHLSHLKSKCMKTKCTYILSNERCEQPNCESTIMVQKRPASAVTSLRLSGLV